MDITEEIAVLSEKVREEVPLVHNITNYVTVNDCANAILAIGGSPIMADDEKEVRQITGLSKALVLNMGTLNERVVSSMLAAGRRANECKIPVVFDPVGAGASAFRNETAERIVKEIKLSVVRGNVSELSFVAGLKADTKGVDAAGEQPEIPRICQFSKEIAKNLCTTVAITGAVDVITDGNRTALVRNGVCQMSKVTGTGCMTSAIIGAFLGSADSAYLAAVSGIVSMGIAGEAAWRRMGDCGLGSFHIGIIDALSHIDAKEIKEMANVEELS